MSGAPTTPRYDQLSLLGQGAMGNVYRAWDTQLARWVALKYLRGDDPAHERRLMQEARAQARVIHENVCRVYEVGKDERGAFIAMQCVEGESLQLVARRLTAEQKVRLMIEVAEAVHEAHRQGLIHRDLKPQNVLVEPLEDGGLKPFVTDFGLARDAGQPGTTVAGTMIGTPHYMAPEQARGEIALLDRRTDVYGLGATLYELLVGNPPFPGAGNLQVLYRTLHEEPESLRKQAAGVPRDLECIVLKCLEKAQDKRYGSARALADDLQRWLDGVPIEARPPGPFERGQRLARRHPALVVGVVASVALLAFVGGGAAWSQRQAAARERAAQRFGQDLQQIESILRYGALMPLHDTGREQALARERMAGIEAQMARLGDYSRGPGEYALGRGLLALRDPDGARVHLERAWQAGFRDPLVSYALGLALGTVYARELKLASRLPADAKAARLVELHKTLRDPALQALREAGSGALEAPEYVEALVALCEARLDEAISRARLAIERLPWLYEARLIEGDALVLRAVRSAEKGDRKTAERDHLLAQTAYGEAIRLAQSDPEGYAGLCSSLAERFSLHTFEAGSELEQDAGRVLAACDQALKLGPKQASLLIAAADVHRLIAEHQGFTGADPAAEVAKVLSYAEAALAVRPGDAAPHQISGRAHWVHGEYLGTRGADPLPAFARAEEALQKALQAAPRDADSINTLGLVHLEIGHVRGLRGQDPAAAIDKCVADFSRLIEMFPKMGRPRQNLGHCLIERVDWALDHGLDVAAPLALAIDSFRAAVKASPTATRSTDLADALASGAELSLREGRDPAPWLAEARLALAAAIENQPRLVDPHLLLAKVNRQAAEHALLSGQPHGPLLRAVFDELAVARRLNERHFNLRLHASVAWLLAARSALAEGKSPQRALEAGSAEVAAGLLQNPASVVLHVIGARLALVASRAALGSGASPLAPVRAGERHARSALRLSPDLADAHLLLAELAAAEAEGAERRGGPTEATIARGLADAAAAARINPSLAAVPAAEAALRLLASHQDRAQLALARDAWARARRLNPLLGREHRQLSERLAPGQGLAAR